MNFFKQRREELSPLTQRDIGNALGFTDKAVGMWENDVCPPPIARAGDLAKVYKVTRRQMVDAIAEQAERLAAAKKPLVAAH